MTFDRSKIQQVTASLNPTCGYQWSYVTTDTMATVKASAYFNAMIQLFNVGDIINVKASDAEGFIVVTSVTTNVTTSFYHPNLLLGTAMAYAGGGTSTTFTITGAATTDNLQATLATAANTVAFEAYISAANTVTVTFASDPGACTMNFAIHKV
jgi:hypothetical protein